MGHMIAGSWVADTDTLDSTSKEGHWQRTPSVIRSWIGRDVDLPAERDRYHLYVAWNCPWAHRVLLVRAILGLEDILPVSIVAPRRTEEGWVFEPSSGYADHLNGHDALHEVYARGQNDYDGRVTVPLLVDSKTGQLVSNESSDLMRMLPEAFGALSMSKIDLYPTERRAEIDDWNDRVHRGLNNGVYRAGFAQTQEAYDAAIEDVFSTLDALEQQIAGKDFVLGEALTEVDLRLFPTLARFDVAYHTAFKCTRKRLIDYPELWDYARRIYALPGVKSTVKFDIYRQGYFSPSPKRNPLGIVATAPDISWDQE
ncbi:MAG: glutathione S-transferase C-terminal domain-containing protein [Pseudomonadota bacterium]